MQLKKLKNPTLILTGILILIIAFTLFFLSNNRFIGNFNSNRVKFIISTEYNEYLEQELIWIKLKIINSSEENFYLHGELSIGAGLDFEIRDDQGNILQSMLVSEYGNRGDSLLVLPGDTIENIANLSWYSANKSAPTKYKILAHCENLVSNEIMVRINKPEGEEKEVFDFMKKDNVDRENIQIDRRLIDSVAINIVNKYPHSRYTPQIYDRLLRSLVIYGDSSTFSESFDIYMINNFNKLTTKFMLTTYKAHLLTYMNNKTEISQKLEELKSKYGNNENLNKIVDKYVKRNIKHEKFWFK